MRTIIFTAFFMACVAMVGLVAYTRECDCPPKEEPIYHVSIGMPGWHVDRIMGKYKNIAKADTIQYGTSTWQYSGCTEIIMQNDTVVYIIPDCDAHEWWYGR